MAIEPLPAYYDDETEEERFLREQAQSQALATLQGGLPSPDPSDRAAPPVPNPGGVPAAGPAGPRPSVFRDPEPPAQAAGPIARGPLPRPTPAQAPTPTPTAPEAGDDADYQRARRAQFIQELIGAASRVGTAVATGGRATAGEVPANALANFQAQRDARQQGQAQRAATGRQEEELGLRRRQVELAERRGESQEALAQSRLRREDVATEAAEGEAASARERRDPESTQSDIARDVYRRLGAEFGIEDIDGLIGNRSAFDLYNDPALERLTAFAQDRELINTRGQFTKYGRASRLRGGGGGGGGQARRSTEAPPAWIEGYRGTPEQAQTEWATLHRDARDAFLEGRARQMGTDPFVGGRQQAARDFRQEQGDEDDVRKLGDDLRDVQEWNTSVARAQEVFRDASDGEMRWILLGQDMPPGLSDARAQLLRGSFSRLRNVILKERSGAAVTAPEFARLNTEMGTARTSSPAVFRQWLENAGMDRSQMNQRIRAGYTGRVVSLYDQNLQRERGAGSAQHQRGGNARSVTLYNADGESREFPLTTQGRDRARRDGFTRRAPP